MNRTTETAPPDLSQAPSQRIAADTPAETLNGSAHASRCSLTTPTGVQSMAVLRFRRWLFASLVVATYAALMTAAATLAAAGGWTTVDAVMFACFAVGTPWAVLGFWNALVGLYLQHGTHDGIAQVAPYLAAADLDDPLCSTSAIVMTVRDEDPGRAFARLDVIKRSVDATGEGRAFDYFILSDTSSDETAAEEARLAADWQRRSSGRSRIIYRRREDNVGFKAGNVRDFCARWGDDYACMLTLDADSLMSGDTIVRMSRIMQAHPKIGILQSLVVGAPSDSAFARIFQFGMRHGMRVYTLGQAWWTADCGPFWGHNAFVRIAPFRDHCDLPHISGKGPLSGAVLSHDQVEATLMRRAGFEVRVVPVEAGSWEDNPPTILDFATRDERWCRGNLQYVHLLGLPGLKSMSRFQLAWAVLMFVGLPAWTLIIALLPVAALEAQAMAAPYPTALALALYASFFVMYLMPKLAGLIDVALTPGGVQRYGGALRFWASGFIELVFSFLQGAVSTLRTTLYMLRIFIFGQAVSWRGQQRDARGLSFANAARALWPQTLFGVVVVGALYVISPSVMAWSLPLTAGYLLAIPFSVLTANPTLGRAMRRDGLAGVPEDFNTPIEIAEVDGRAAHPGLQIDGLLPPQHVTAST